VPLRRFKTRRRAVVSATAVAAVLLAGGIAASLASGGSASGETHLDGNPSTVLYAAGHRPQVPDFSGTTLTGAHLRFSSYQGKVVVLNFWGSWCAPCRSEGQTLAALSAKYQGSGVRFLGVDVQDTPTNAEAFEQGFGIKYPSLNDPGGSIAQVLGSAVPVLTPTTLVIDKSGQVAGAIFGTATYSVLDSMLSKVTAS
jgi:thiol-disulfide isomerase/thioredoxin